VVRSVRVLQKRRMMDDWDEDDDYRWSQDMTQQMNRTGRRTQFWLDGWMDGRTHGYLLSPAAGRVSVLEACSAFAFELNYSRNRWTSHRNGASM
jgi:hypothetical protein